MTIHRCYTPIRRAGAALIFTLFATTAVSAMDLGLVSQLTDKLGVSEEQAMGGAGAIFGYAKDNLEVDEFASIAEGIPNMDGLLSAAPEVDEDSTMGKIGGMLGDSGGSMDGLSSLAGSFDSLGLNMETAQQFLPIVYDYVKGASGEQAMGLLKGLF